MKREINHYDYLNKHLPNFIKTVVDPKAWDWNRGIISAHGDKFYSYRNRWEKAGIHFFHGCMIMMLTYIPPFSKETRDEVVCGKWVDPANWVINNYKRFSQYLPPIEDVMIDINTKVWFTKCK